MPLTIRSTLENKPHPLFDYHAPLDHGGSGLHARGHLTGKSWHLPNNFPRADLHAPPEELRLNIPTLWEDYCGTAIRSWTQILND